MNPLESELLSALEQAQADLSAVNDEQAYEAARIKYLSRNGLLAMLTAKLGGVPKEDKPAVGKTLNSVKKDLQAAFDACQARLASDKEAHNALDVSLPGRTVSSGHRHPIFLVLDAAIAIFRRMGFTVADGPDIDTVWDNFDALNAPADHPSRSPEDNFYFDLEHCDYMDPHTLLLRSQTSDVQIRTMLANKPPVRIICPGRCYRRDTPDATHGMSFHQIEGLYVDEVVSLADLKGCLATFAREMFGARTQIRFRPHHFPFTEPSVEADASCMACGGKGCRICKGSGWIEIGGAGIVNPAVLKNVNYDPERVSGFAFGLGIERLAMIRYGINDLRLLYDNDMRFLHQF